MEHDGSGEKISGGGGRFSYDLPGLDIVISVHVCVSGTRWTTYRQVKVRCSLESTVHTTRVSIVVASKSIFVSLCWIVVYWVLPSCHPHSRTRAHVRLARSFVTMKMLEFFYSERLHRWLYDAGRS